MKQLSTSIVMETYNGEQFIKEQLDSLIAQTVKPLEIIISDDGSHDKTINIIKDFTETSGVKIDFRQTPQNLGFGENFLTAASRARGDLVAFCDQDDIWDERKIETVAQSFRDPSIVLAVHKAELIGKSGNSLGKFDQGIAQNRTREPLSQDPWNVRFGFSMTFRKSLLDVIPYDRRGIDFITGKGKLSHDRWIQFLANSFGTTREINEYLVKYRQHDNNIFGALANNGIMSRLRKLRPELVREEGDRYLLSARQQRNIFEQIDESVIKSFPAYSRDENVQCWDRIVDILQARQNVYRSKTIWRSFKVICRNLENGVYINRDTGKNSAKPIVKDIVAAIIARILRTA